MAITQLRMTIFLCNVCRFLPSFKQIWKLFSILRKCMQDTYFKSEASILGWGKGGGGQGGSLPPPPPRENIGGQTYRFAPPPPNKQNKKKKNRQLENFIICNARIGIKSTIRPYKTIKFYITILLNIHNFQFCGALHAQIFIMRLCNFPYSCPPPPNPKNGSTPLFQIQIHFSLTEYIMTKINLII